MQNKSTGGFWSDNKFTFKGILIGVLIILMLIPTLYIMGLIDERAKRKQEVVKDISSKWATEQTFTGPFLIIPYLDDSPGVNSTASKKYAYFLPAELNIQAELNPQTREKSIYKVVVYKAGMQVNGHFSALAGDPVANSTSLLWQEAQLCLGIDDFTGIEDQLIVQWNGHPLTLNAGIPDTHIIKHGLSTQIALTEDDLNNNLSFSINVQLRGSDRINFTPVGKSTQVNLRSTWQHPSFEGRFVPANKPAISDKGFNAQWKVQHLNRSFPQSWKNEQYTLDEWAFSVRLLEPVDGYTQTMRSAKYAILFIALTFGLYFFIELFQKKYVHPIQYVLVGIALCLFYTLLLSISEYLAFSVAYAVAAGATIALITFYSRSLFGKWSTALLLGLLLSMLYGFIYILIQLEDNALLFGSIGLFILLALIMYYSRKIQWYAKDPAQTVTHLSPANV